MQGWICLYRELLDKPIWRQTNASQKAILITLLLMANHKEKEWLWNGKKFKAKPGQFVTSLENIANKAGKDITPRQVRTAIDLYKKLDFLSNESSKTGRLISITNWESYQSEEKKSQSKSQTPVKEVSTNNNVINIHNLVPFEEIKKSFNEICLDLPNIKGITSKRKTKVANRWKEQSNINYWIEIFKKVQASDYLTGRNGKWLNCSFDWIFENDNNYIKIDEGKYSNKGVIKGSEVEDDYCLPG